jgi:hypothetical protein
VEANLQRVRFVLSSDSTSALEEGSTSEHNKECQEVRLPGHGFIALLFIKNNSHSQDDIVIIIDKPYIRSSF